MSRALYSTKIAGTGSYLPPKLLTNKDLEKMVETTDEWITERTGIKVRHMAEPHEACSDLAYHASVKALEAAQINPKEIDAIIVATTSPDHVMPSTACNLQHKLKANNCMAFDLTAACSGFIYAMSIADQFIKTGQYKNILCVGAEVLHKFVDYKDRHTCILFGDGAGAMVLSRAENEGAILTTHCHAEGALAELLMIPMGGSKIAPSHEAIDNNLHTVKMQGREIFKHAIRAMGSSAKEALNATNMTYEDVSWFIPHQANTRIIDAVARHISFPKEKVIVEIEEMGNTSSATVPVVFDKAVRDGRIQRGQNILLAAFGGGLTSASALLRY